MSWLPGIFRRRSVYRDLSEEVRLHLEEKTEELVRGGMKREEAAYAARRAFGNATVIEERSREVWQWPRIESLWADARFALRQLVRAPAFTAAAALTLALGIGANTAIITLVHALLLQSLPIPEPDRLVRIALDVNSPNGVVNDLPLNLFFLQSIQRHAKSLSGAFGWSSYDFVLKEETGLHIYSGAVVSGNTFQVLGISPAAGRLLTPADGSPDEEPVAFAAQFDDAMSEERLLSVLSGFFAVLALLLSGIGVYGLMASYVTRRTTEIGVRMALGATRANIFSLVMSKVALLLAVGVAGGGCLAWFAARSIKAFLFDVNPGNPAIFVAAISILALSGLVAALLPARRAVSIEPMQALRNE